MSKPEISVENYDEIYNYYAKSNTHPRFAKFGHGVMGLVYRPEASFEPGAEDQIAAHFQEGGSMIVASNHVNIHDQFSVAALAGREDVLSPLIGNTIIPAKVSLFKYPGLRYLVEGMGSVPTFRHKDVVSNPPQPGDQEKLKMKQSADMRLIRLMTGALETGRNIAIFPEGTRNADNPARLQKIQRGVGVIAHAAGRKANVAILPVGLSYGQSVMRPRASVGNLLRIQGYKNSSEIIADLHAALQACVDRAVNGE